MLSFRLVSCLAIAAAAAMAADGRVDIPLDKKPFTTFHYELEWDKPFLYPLRTASGAVITRSQDHPVQRGLWFGHGDINGIDFWRELGEGKSGRMEIKFPPKVELADRSALLSADFRLIAPDGTAIIGSVRQEFQIARKDDNNVIDARFTVSADQDKPLKMGATEEGPFGIRIADEFREDRSAKAILGKAAKWVDYSSTVGGEKCGVAVFDHPANPFPRDGGRTIPAGGKMDFRYRVVIHSGDAKSARLESLYDEFRGQ